MLALAAAAVVAGMKGYTAIAGWVRDVPPPVLADLYLRAGAGSARPPSKATIWRVVTDADADAFDATVGSWLMSSLLSDPAAQGAQEDHPAGLVPVRLDGKTVRGVRDSEGNQRHHSRDRSGCDRRTTKCVSLKRCQLAVAAGDALSGDYRADIRSSMRIALKGSVFRQEIDPEASDKPSDYGLRQWPT